MKSKSKDLKKTVPDKNASLERVINRNEKIKENVKQAANELTSVNEILKQGKEDKIPVQMIKEAITQNKEVEYKVAKAADDLHQVNTELAKEVVERLGIETELSDMKIYRNPRPKKKNPEKLRFMTRLQVCLTVYYLKSTSIMG